MTDKSSNDEIVKQESAPVDKERRRISKAAVASPILASLASPSVWGTVCSVSGLQSGNASHNNYECGGSGCTPGYWKTHPAVWPWGFSAGACASYNGNSGNCNSWSYDTASKISEILDGVSVSVFGESFTGGVGITDDDAIMKILVDLGGTESGKGSAKAKIAHWVAAVFNSIVAPDAYGATLSDLYAALHAAVDGTASYTLDDLMNVLTNMNESGDCFISGGSGNAPVTCDSVNGVQYIWDPTPGSNTCIPACDAGKSFDWATKTCVPTGTEASYEAWCAGDGAGAPECVNYTST